MERNSRSFPGLCSSMVSGTQECGVSLLGLLGIWMIWSQVFFSQSQDTLIKSLRFLIFALIVIEACYAEKRYCCIRMLGSQCVLPNS